MTPQLRKLNEAEHSKALEQWADRITGIAISMCIHAKSGDKDPFGHSAFPCAECVRVVDHVTKQWVKVLGTEYSRASNVLTPVVMPLHTAYRAVGAVLEPDWAVAMDPVGRL